MTQHVAWRTSGYQLRSRDEIDVLRFEVADLNQVIKGAAAASPLYRALLQQGGLTAQHSVLPLSCFAVTPVWSPTRLAQGTRYRSYRQAEARVLIGAGYPLWPTAVFDDNQPDARNEVHFDLIIRSGTDLRLEELAGSREQRASARQRLAPDFQRLIALLGAPRVLPEVAE